MLAEHLDLLHGTHSGLGIENNYPHSGYIPETLHGCFAGVAAGGGEDEHILGLPAFFPGGFHQMGKQTQSHILESAGRAMEEFQHGIITHRL